MFTRLSGYLQDILQVEGWCGEYKEESRCGERTECWDGSRAEDCSCQLPIRQKMSGGGGSREDVVVRIEWYCVVVVGVEGRWRGDEG